MRQAVDELRKLGIKCELVKNSTIRGYMGRPINVDYALKMEGCAYDVGFDKQKDGSYVPQVESMASDVARTIGTTAGAKTVDGKACQIRGGEAMLGRLVQLVNVITAENNAARSGHTTQRVDAGSGIINVEVTVAA